MKTEFFVYDIADHSCISRHDEKTDDNKTKRRTTVTVQQVNWTESPLQMEGGGFAFSYDGEPRHEMGQKIVLVLDPQSE